MTRYALLVPLAFVFMGCGPGQEGDSCKENADCDEEADLICVKDATDATADEEGTCEVDEAEPPAE